MRHLTLFEELLRCLIRKSCPFFFIEINLIAKSESDDVRAINTCCDENKNISSN